MAWQTRSSVPTTSSARWLNRASTTGEKREKVSTTNEQIAAYACKLLSNLLILRSLFAGLCVR
jgi:hypothetical protein